MSMSAVELHCARGSLGMMESMNTNISSSPMRPRVPSSPSW